MLKNLEKVGIQIRLLLGIVIKSTKKIKKDTGNIDSSQQKKISSKSEKFYARVSLAASSKMGVLISKLKGTMISASTDALENHVRPSEDIRLCQGADRAFNVPTEKKSVACTASKSSKTQQGQVSLILQRRIKINQGK